MHYGTNNPRSWITLLLVILGIGLVAGLSLSNSDWVNPKTRSAMADRIAIENQIMARQKASEFRYQEEKRQEELQYLRARNERNLVLGTLIRYTLAAAVLIVAGGAAVGLAVRLVGTRYERRELHARSLERRAVAIEQARQQEQRERWLQLAEKRLVRAAKSSTADPGQHYGDNGKHVERIATPILDAQFFSAQSQRR